jgi:uncharacterized iron-regulated membrane protein
MEHGEHMRDYAGGNGSGIVLLLLALALLAVVAVLIWGLASRRRPEAPPEDAAQTEIRENLDGQIMSMLHQAGGTMPQSDIAANLDLSVDEVAVALRQMEEQGRISRTWRAEDYTFTVHSR